MLDKILKKKMIVDRRKDTRRKLRNEENNSNRKKKYVRNFNVYLLYETVMMFLMSKKCRVKI